MPRSRFARAIISIYHYAGEAPLTALAQLNAVMTSARCLDYAARLRDYGLSLPPGLALAFAEQAGIGAADLRLLVLPSLRDAGVVSFTYSGAELSSIEEYVGLRKPILEQLVDVFEVLGPSDVEYAAVRSVQLASYAPLAKSDHLNSLVRQAGHTDEQALRGLQLVQATGAVQQVRSLPLGEHVVYNPSVWGSQVVGDIASFLHHLPSVERDALLGVVEQASVRPGLSVPSAGPVDPAVLTAARKVGLVDSATVKSTAGAGASQTYLFSPLTEASEARLRTTEALHERKLFTAHIMFGTERAVLQGGRIHSPVVLVQALLNKGYVGPAPNIASDYHLVEARGIVEVKRTPDGPLLRLVKRDIVEDALGWIKDTYGGPEAVGEFDAALLRSPTTFTAPEQDRKWLPDAGAAREVSEASILRLRDQAAKATHDPF